MIPHGVEIFVALEPIDLRWGFDRLAGLVSDQLGRPARSGALFVFRGKRGEAMFREDPARVINAAAWQIAIAVILICAGGLVPSFVLVVACFAVAFGLLAILAPAFGIAVLSVIPSGMRPHAAALLGIALALGGFAGALLLGSVDTQYGVTGTMIALVIPGIVGSLILRGAAPLGHRDSDEHVPGTLPDHVEMLPRAGRPAGRRRWA